MLGGDGVHGLLRGEVLQGADGGARTAHVPLQPHAPPPPHDGHGLPPHPSGEQINKREISLNPGRYQQHTNRSYALGK
eukprot:4951211-Pyramimonas_sp.AAC.1